MDLQGAAVGAAAGAVNPATEFLEPVCDLLVDKSVDVGGAPVETVHCFMAFAGSWGKP